ncbi:MAG: hypothetical protein PHD61_08025 [Bacteroidales bacterium]|nr:hypothetical protein [Lentimicrobiaceae bacterium]MDD5695238.1 hypothetical protein [Bacteroidales bacterium]
MKQKVNNGNEEWPSTEQILEWERVARTCEKQVRERRGPFLTKNFHHACSKRRILEYLLLMIDLYQCVDDIYKLDYQWWEANQIGNKCYVTLKDAKGNTILHRELHYAKVYDSICIVVDFGVIMLAEEMETRSL